VVQAMKEIVPEYRNSKKWGGEVEVSEQRPVVKE
jgi:hypothetical protein